MQKKTTLSALFVPTSPKHLAILTLTGGVLFLILMLLFLSSVNQPKPEWGFYWKVRPLLVTPTVGALSGVGVYYLLQWQRRFNWNRWVIGLVVLAGCLAGFFFGFVLGLDGTLWN